MEAVAVAASPFCRKWQPRFTEFHHEGHEKWSFSSYLCETLLRPRSGWINDVIARAIPQAMKLGPCGLCGPCGPCGPCDVLSVIAPALATVSHGMKQGIDDE